MSVRRVGQWRGFGCWFRERGWNQDSRRLVRRVGQQDRRSDQPRGVAAPVRARLIAEDHRHGDVIAAADLFKTGGRLKGV